MVSLTHMYTHITNMLNIVVGLHAIYRRERSVILFNISKVKELSYSQPQFLEIVVCIVHLQMHCVLVEIATNL